MVKIAAKSGVVNFPLKYHRRLSRRYPSYVIGADVGGTNTCIGVAGITGGKPELLFSFHFSSRELDSLSPALSVVLDYAHREHGIRLQKACIAAAGPPSIGNDYCKLTNLDWSVSVKDILRKTGLESAFIINDFEAVGYSVNLLSTGSKTMFKAGGGRSKKSKAAKAVLGAGTGFGKTILAYSECHKAYIPLPSEGGHADFPAQDGDDIKLLDFIRDYRNTSQVTCEDVLSGRGIEAICMFLLRGKKFRGSKYTEEIEDAADKVPLISKYRRKDETCRETFNIYSRYYGRVARDFALEALATGGVYIGGGVAQKNSEIFRSRGFLNEFRRSEAYSKLLGRIPVYVIVDSHAGMLGAAYAAVIRDDIIKRVG
ncbi:MAG: glucokinase [Candidatus Altiarchaeota archaeon]